MNDQKGSLTAEELADGIESLALSLEATAVGLTALDRVVRRGWPRSAQHFSVAMHLIERREQLLGNAYPLNVRPEGIYRRNDPRGAWYTCLPTMSPRTVFRDLADDSSVRSIGIQFEQLTALAVRMFLGGDSVALRFAWPSDSGRPPEFPEAIMWLAAKMGLQLGHGYRPPRRKDGGVDIVAWRPFADGRPGFPIVLTQCTVQRSVLDKAADIDLRSWATWLRMLRDPMTVLAVPFVLSASTEEWNEVSQRHIIFDRLRLVELLASCETETDTYRSLTQAATDRLSQALRHKCFAP